MAQKIIIPAHKVKLIDLKKSIPNGKFKKIFFQCALKEIRNNGAHREAVFFLIAYVGKRNIFQHWDIGSKVNCDVDDSVPPKEFNLADYSEPIAFGNNEANDFDFTLKKKKLKTTNKKQAKQSDLMDKIKKLLKDPEKSKTAYLTLQAKISSNPHVTYDISIDGTAASANPSPPADPA